jgi:hypothetical protein
MKRQDLFGLKYFIAFGLVVIGFYVYSAMVGWKWFNPTSTEKNEPTKRGIARGIYPRYFHK